MNNEPSLLFFFPDFVCCCCYPRFSTHRMAPSIFKMDFASQLSLSGRRIDVITNIPSPPRLVSFFTTGDKSNGVSTVPSIELYFPLHQRSTASLLGHLCSWKGIDIYLLPSNICQHWDLIVMSPVQSRTHTQSAEESLFLLALNCCYFKVLVSLPRHQLLYTSKHALAALSPWTLNRESC